MSQNDRITEKSGALTRALAPLVAERIGLQKKLPRVHDRYRVGPVRDGRRERTAIQCRIEEIRAEESQIRFDHRRGEVKLSMVVKGIGDISKIKNKLDFLPPGHEVIIRPVKING